MSVVEWGNGKAYFFRDDKYVRYDIAADKPEEGGPRRISDAWPGVFERDLDAALVWGDGKAYFFKGDEYVRYDVAADRADEGYPRQIAGSWPGVFEKNIDAALMWGDGKAYFFKGDEYVRYDVATDRVDVGYPRRIADGWPGVFERDLDAAVMWTNGKVYFFKGEEYVRYDVKADCTDEGYPRSITDGWPGLFAKSNGGAAPIPASGDTSFANGQQIDDWFVARTGRGFVDWFNAEQAKSGAWANAEMSGSSARDRFLQLWDRLSILFDKHEVSLPEVLGLMGIVIHETGGTLTPLSERVGAPGHPGIAYAFDAIPKLKVSYNKAPNLTAGQLFGDPTFMAAHGHLPLADKVKGTSDPVWDGATYPANRFPTSTDASVSGIILETDFYKFRGRGLIQTTWRAGYRRLIQFVQATRESDSVIQRFKADWSGCDPGAVATASSNLDWDALFQESGYVIPCQAIRIHNKDSGNYLALSSDRSVLEGRGPGSAWHAGKKVNGGDAYADKFRSRVLQMLAALER